MFAMIAQVALGGAIGSVLRFLAVAWIGAPIATLVVNVAGSFAMGLCFVLLASRAQTWPFVMSGVLGGFTTFSAFSLDTLRLWHEGAVVQAAGYALGSVALSLAGVALGVALARGAF